MERRRWLEYWQRQGRDNPPCVGIMRRCGPLKISDGLGLSSNSCTSASRSGGLPALFAP